MNIIGRVTGDATVHTLKDDRQVVHFSVAVNDSYRNRAGEQVKRTEYFDCSYWISPNVVKILTKGTLVELLGRVSARAWLGNDGQPRANLNFHTSRITLHGGGRAENDEAKNKKATGAVVSPDGDDLPF